MEEELWLAGMSKVHAKIWADKYDELGRIADSRKVVIEGLEAENARLEKRVMKQEIPKGYSLISNRHIDALADGLAEIKATNDGHSDQSISEIIEWVLSEIEASDPPIYFS